MPARKRRRSPPAQARPPAWIDPVKNTVYVLMVQRANFKNSDASDVRSAFQEAVSQPRL
jgi:hypothetical protein